MLAVLLAALTFTDPAATSSGLVLAQASPAPKAPAAPHAPKATPAPPAPPATPALPAPPAPRQTGVLRGDWPAQPSGKRITLNDELDIDDALTSIADHAGWDLSLNTGRTGNRTLVLRLRDVPVEEAVRVVLANTGLVAIRQGNIVTVAEDGLPAEVAPAQTLTGFDKPTGRMFTGDFENTPVADALRQIAKAAGLSIVLPPGETTPISASFKDTPVEDALRAVLGQAELVAERQGSLVTVKRAGGFPFLPPGMPAEARRAAERAMREAQRDLQRAGREAGRDREGSDNGRDRQVTGENLTIRGGDQVRDVNVVKGNLIMQGGANARDVSVVSGSAEVQGGAGVRDLAVVLGSATLEPGATARQVVAVGGDVDVRAGASVEQDAISIGGRVRIDPDAEVGGTSRSIPFPSLPNVVTTTVGSVFGGQTSPVRMVAEALLRFIVMFLVGLLILAVIPRRLESVTASLTNAPWKSVLTGLVATLAMPVLALLLVVTVVGIPLVFVQGLLLLAAGAVGVTALTYYVGRTLPLPEHRRTQVIQLAVGTLLFCILAEIPVVGLAVKVATWLLTFGAVVRTRFGQPPAVLPTTLPPAIPGVGA